MRINIINKKTYVEGIETVRILRAVRKATMTTQWLREKYILSPINNNANNTYFQCRGLSYLIMSK